ncbi:unnamed protein product [Amoebophrya sp. A120]|nr:unnamed protein product [Amoebophrya sp. A120]|eukprot:GSA120T00025960001.1
MVSSPPRRAGRIDAADRIDAAEKRTSGVKLPGINSAVPFAPPQSAQHQRPPTLSHFLISGPKNPVQMENPSARYGFDTYGGQTPTTEEQAWMESQIQQERRERATASGASSSSSSANTLHPNVLQSSSPLVRDSVPLLPFNNSNHDTSMHSNLLFNNRNNAITSHQSHLQHRPPTTPAFGERRNSPAIQNAQAPRSALLMADPTVEADKDVSMAVSEDVSMMLDESPLGVPIRGAADVENMTRSTTATRNTRAGGVDNINLIEPGVTTNRANAHASTRPGNSTTSSLAARTRPGTVNSGATRPSPSGGLTSSTTTTRVSSSANVRPPRPVARTSTGATGAAQSRASPAVGQGHRDAAARQLSGPVTSTANRVRSDPATLRTGAKRPVDATMTEPQAHTSRGAAAADSVTPNAERAQPGANVVAGRDQSSKHRGEISETRSCMQPESQVSTSRAASSRQLLTPIAESPAQESSWMNKSSIRNQLSLDQIVAQTEAALQPRPGSSSSSSGDYAGLIEDDDKPIVPGGKSLKWFRDMHVQLDQSLSMSRAGTPNVSFLQQDASVLGDASIVLNQSAVDLDERVIRQQNLSKMPDADAPQGPLEGEEAPSFADSCSISDVEPSASSVPQAATRGDPYKTPTDDFDWINALNQSILGRNDEVPVAAPVAGSYAMGLLTADGPLAVNTVNRYVDETMNLYRDVENKFFTLQQEKSSFVQQLKDKKAAVGNATVAVRAKRGAVQEALLEKKEALSKAEDMEGKKRAKDAELETARKAAEDQETKEKKMADTLAGRQNEAARIQQEIADLEKLDFTSKRRGSYRQDPSKPRTPARELANKNARENKIKQEEAKTRERDEQVAKLKAERDSLLSDNLQLQEALQDHKELLKKQTDKVTRLETEVTDLTGQVEEAREKAASLQKQVDELDMELTSAKMNEAAAELEVKNVQRELEKKGQQIAALRQELEELREKMTEKDKEHDKFIEQHKNALYQNDGITDIKRKKDVNALQRYIMKKRELDEEVRKAHEEIIKGLCEELRMAQEEEEEQRNQNKRKQMDDLEEFDNAYQGKRQKTTAREEEQNS